MRLIHTITHELQEFAVDIPPYAILSHTWGKDEITCQEYGSDVARDTLGYLKINYLCSQAQSDGFQYVWADTVCIDKTSSAELSEAINSMMQWYSAAEICYAFLDDVSDLDHLHLARWFTRGWTLQELLAPTKIQFFGQNWQLLGSKSDLFDRISLITKIHPLALTTRKGYTFFNVATRMSWVAGRETTRPEDLAYSLLGLFDVHMPPIYGEGGSKAFIRLQSQIIHASNDNSILAWESNTMNYPNCLASHPMYFKNSKLVSWSPANGQHYVLTNRGLHIRMPLLTENIKDGRTGRLIEMTWGILNCRYEQSLDGYIALALHATGIQQTWRRHEPIKLAVLPEEKVKTLSTSQTIYLLTDSEYAPHARSGRLPRSICKIEPDGVAKYGFDLDYKASQNARLSWSEKTMISEVMYVEYDRQKIERHFIFSNPYENVGFKIDLITPVWGGDEFYFSGVKSLDVLQKDVGEIGERRFGNKQAVNETVQLQQDRSLEVTVHLSRKLKCEIWIWICKVSVKIS